MKKENKADKTLLDLVRGEFRKNWKTITILVLLFAVGLFLRSYFYYQESQESGVELSGNDPYYHKRVIDYVQDEKQHLVRDRLLGYPAEPFNPRPPIFDWSIAITGMTVGNLFGDVAGVTAFITAMAPSFWGAMTIIPVYFFTKEFFGKKAALWSALFLAIMPSHIDRSSYGFADHDSFVLFFVVATFYFMVKSLRYMRTGRYIENFLSPRSIKDGMSRFGHKNKIALGYAMMAGLSLSTVALAWKGVSYVYAIIMAYYLVQLVVNMFKHEDSTSVAALILVVLTLPILLALPAYASMHMLWSQWGLKPVIYIFIGLLAVTVAFVPTRDVPWLILLPVLIVLGISSYYVIDHFNPDLAETIFSGAGYFVKTKRYSTIAEAQAPILSRLIISYGPVTFFFALVGIMFAAHRFWQTWATDELFVVIWAGVSVFMAISAVRFMFNAGPAFAVLQGWIAYYIMKKTDFGAIGRSLRGFQGQFFYGLKKGFRAKHAIVALFMVFMVLLPNAWLAFDASLPFEKKREMDNQIYDLMPDYLQPEKYDRDRDLWYVGAFGQGFPSEYWHSYFEWQAEQDTEFEMEQRPAFLSWWDYGMWCVEIGEHPTVADNFMNGHELAGNFIASQNESKAIALLITRVLEFEIRGKKGSLAEDLVYDYLGEEDGDKFVNAMRNPDDYIDHIKTHPQKFGRKEGLRRGNAKYSMCSYILMKQDIDTLVDMLTEAEDLTGNWIRYFGVDSRMFPFSYYNTGIFYAPITLSDHYVSDFLETKIRVGDQVYSPEEFLDLRELDPTLEADEFVLDYTKAFFNTMFYKAYIGYSTFDIGAPKNYGIPGISGQLFQSPPQQGWNMKHFKLIYKTTYWNPHTEQLKKHADDWEVVTFEEGLKLAEAKIGTVDFQRGLGEGTFVLKYYPGAKVSGRLTTNEGVGISNAMVSIFDEFGIVKDSSFTDEDGNYDVISPSGNNITLRATSGGDFNNLTMGFQNELATQLMNITEDQAERRKVDADGDGRFDYIITQDIMVDSTQLNGTAFIDSNHDDDMDSGEDVLSNAVLELNGTNTIEVTTDDQGYYNTSSAIEGAYSVFLHQDGKRYDLGVAIDSTGLTPAERDIPVKGYKLEGQITDSEEEDLSGITVRLTDGDTAERYTAETDDSGKYQFEDLLPGENGFTTYTLNINEDGKVPITRTLRGEIGKADDIDIELRNQSTISGALLADLDGDGKGETPAGGALVVAMSKGQNFEAISDRDGKFELTVPEAQYRICVQHLDGADHYGGEVTAMAPADIDMELERLYAIGGTLFIDGNLDGEYDNVPDTEGHSAGINITGERNWNGKANQLGYFSAFLPAGEYRVSMDFRDNQGVNHLNSTALTIERDIDQDFELIEAERVTGNVWWDRNLDGNPQSDEYLRDIPLTFTGDHNYSTGAGGKSSFTSVTGTNGTFNVDLIPGNYTVDAPNFNSVELPDEIFASLNMTPMTTRVEGLLWSDDDQNLVLDADEVAGNGALIEFTGIDDPNFYQNTTTDKDGAYAIDLMPGRYHVISNSSDSNDEILQVNEIFDLPFSLEEIRHDFFGFHLFNLQPEFLIDGVPVDPATFGDDDVIRILPTGVRDNNTIPAHDGRMDWQNGGFLIGGIFNIYARYNNRAYLETVVVDESGPLQIDLEPGFLYSGGLKVKDDRDIINRNLGDLGLTFVSPSGADITEVLRYSPTGTTRYNYNMVLPHGDFSAQINHSRDDDLYLMDEPLGNDTLTIVRNFEVKGRAYYDWDDDGKRDNKEAIQGVKIQFDGNRTSRVVTDHNGNYLTYLPFGDSGVYNITILTDGYNSIPNPTTVNLPTGTTDIELIPKNITVSGVAFSDRDLDGIADPDELLDIRELEFIPDVESRSAVPKITGSSYSIELAPSVYQVYAVAEEHSYLSTLDLEIASEGQMDINMTESVNIQGKLYYQNLTGKLRTPYADEIKSPLTFVLGEEEIEVELTAGEYSAIIPAGTYTVKAKASITEYGLEAEYTISKEFDILEAGSYDFELERKNEYDVRLKWNDDSIQRAHPNSSVEYQVTIENEANVPENRIKLSTSSVPAGWDVEFDEEEFTLGIDEVRKFNVKIHVDGDTPAGRERIRVKAVPTGESSDDDTENVYVNVTAYYDFKIDAIFPHRGIVAGTTAPIDFVVVNEGNAPDTYELEFPDFPEIFEAQFHNETEGEILDTNGNRQVDTGKVGEFGFFPVFIKINATEDAEGAFSIPVTVTSATTGETKVVTLGIEATLPDLTVDDLTAESVKVPDGFQVYLNTTVHNSGIVPVENATFQFYMDGKEVGQRQETVVGGRPLGDGIVIIPVDGNTSFSLMINVTDKGEHSFRFSIYFEEFDDLDQGDNSASTSAQIGRRSDGGGGGDDLMIQMITLVIVMFLLFVAYSVYRRRRRW